MSGTSDGFSIDEHGGPGQRGYELRIESPELERTWWLVNPPPVSGAEKRLAIEQPPGVRARGAARPWDSGPVTVSHAKKRKVRLVFRGERIKGSYLLLMPAWGINTERKLWLLFKVG